MESAYQSPLRAAGTVTLKGRHPRQRYDPRSSAWGADKHNSLFFKTRLVSPATLATKAFTMSSSPSLHAAGVEVAAVRALVVRLHRLHLDPDAAGGADGAFRVGVDGAGGRQVVDLRNGGGGRAWTLRLRHSRSIPEARSVDSRKLWAIDVAARASRARAEDGESAVAVHGCRRPSLSRMGRRKDVERASVATE
jgi:hypothetical protein